MSRTTTESKDGVFCNDQIESPLMDEGNSGGSDGGLVLKKGPWTSAEDAILVDYVKKHGEGNWNSVQKHSGLFRCGKSCRLRWANHLRPNLKKGAFTQEEERLIIELHAKMGNKWARMAAHLPGRTDNEIKNYWNTRIKRRHRAGLPLYPPELSLQAMQESQQDQNTTETNAGDRGHQSLFQSNSYEIPDVIFDSLKVNQGVLPYVPDISSTSMLMKHLGSPQYCTFAPPTSHRQKRLRESTSMFSGYNEGIKNCFPLYDQLQDDAGDLSAQSCGLPFPVDPDLDDANKNSLSFGVIQGGHSLSNGNFSASKPTCEAVKLELPSLQHSETALSSWAASSPLPALDSVDAFIQSPPSGDFDSDCVSPRNSGLLDALLYEAKTLSSVKNHSSDMSSNSSSVNPIDVAVESSHLNVSETEWQDYDDPLSPLGHSSTSLFSECTPLSATGSSLDEHPAEAFTGSNMKSDSVTETWPSDRQKETTTQLYSDSLLASDWFEQNTEDQATMTDAIAALLGDDLGSEYMHITTGTSHAGQGWGFGSCAWNNMPAVCQMSEIP